MKHKKKKHKPSDILIKSRTTQDEPPQITTKEKKKKSGLAQQRKKQQIHQLTGARAGSTKTEYVYKGQKQKNPSLERNNITANLKAQHTKKYHQHKKKKKKTKKGRSDQLKKKQPRKKSKRNINENHQYNTTNQVDPARKPKRILNRPIKNEKMLQNTTT